MSDQTTDTTPPAGRMQGNGSGPNQAADPAAAVQEPGTAVIPGTAAPAQPAGTTAPAQPGSGKQQAVLVALGAPGGLAAAVIVLLTAFNLVTWSDFQTSLVTAEAVAVIGLFGALVGHFWRDSAQEPVALAATFTATVAATLALCNGFGWLTWTQDQITAVLGVFTAFLGVGSALFARSLVTAESTPKKAGPKGTSN